LCSTLLFSLWGCMATHSKRARFIVFGERPILPGEMRISTLSMSSLVLHSPDLGSSSLSSVSSFIKPALVRSVTAAPDLHYYLTDFRSQTLLFYGLLLSSPLQGSSDTSTRTLNVQRATPAHIIIAGRLFTYSRRIASLSLVSPPSQYLHQPPQPS
jgi:hypothetical protein